MTDNATTFAAALTSTSEQRGRRYRNESNVKVDLSQLIGELGYGPVETEHPIPGGAIDIYVPHHRVIIETKARGLAADPHKPQGADRESPKEQLDRYVLSELRTELSTFDWDHPEDRSRQPWVGVVTDGTIWYSWRYPHEENPEVETIPARTTSNADALIDALTAAFGTERTGKPWVPADPAADLFREHEKALESLYRQLPRAVQTRTETKRQLWLDMLRVSGIAPHDNDADRLFVTHSLLIGIARLVAHGLTWDREDWLAALDDGFVSWITDSRPGREWAPWRFFAEPVPELMRRAAREGPESVQAAQFGKMLVPCLGPHRVVGEFVPIQVELASDEIHDGRRNELTRSQQAARVAELQREAQLVAGTPPGPDVLQVFVAQGVVAQQVGLALRKGKQGRPLPACQNGSPSHSLSLDVCEA